MAFLPPERAGQLLRTARRGAGLNRRRAALAARIAPARLAEIERGWVDVSADEFDRLARTYGSSIDALVPGRAVATAPPAWGSGDVVITATRCEPRGERYSRSA